MTISDKLRVVISILAAAVLFGVCIAVCNSEALPLWARIAVDVLAVTNLACTTVTAQEASVL